MFIDVYPQTPLLLSTQSVRVGGVGEDDDDNLDEDGIGGDENHKTLEVHMYRYYE